MKSIQIFLLIMLIALSGCKPRQTITQVPVRTIERKVTTLVPVYVPGDSTTLRAYFECDSMNNVLLRKIDESKSKNIATGYSFDDGVLDYSAKTQPDTVYVTSDTVYTEKEVAIIHEVPVEVNVLTKWQMIRMKVGDIVLLLVIAFAAWKLIKMYMKYKKL